MSASNKKDEAKTGSTDLHEESAVSEPPAIEAAPGSTDLHEESAVSEPPAIVRQTESPPDATETSTASDHSITARLSDTSKKVLHHAIDNPIAKGAGKAVHATKAGAGKAVHTTETVLKDKVAAPVLKAPGKLVHKVTGSPGGKKKGEPAAGEQQEATDDGAKEASKVPPDETLQNMQVILKKRLTNVSVKDFYAIAWSEGEGTVEGSADPPAKLYGPWLVSQGKENVNVGEWQDGQFVNNWNQEAFDRKRTVTFQFEKVLPMSTGPKTLSVTHTQWVRLDDERCVLAMQVATDGIPYGGSFLVEIRWVATSVNKDLNVEVGLFVYFTKQVMVASKIRSNTITETTKAQSSLFQTIRKACGSVEVEVPATAEEPPTPEQTQMVSGLWQKLADEFAHLLEKMFPFLHKDTEYRDDIDRELARIEHKLDLIRKLPSVAADEEAAWLDYARSAFVEISAAFDSIFVRDSQLTESVVLKNEAADERQAASDSSKSLVNTFAAPFEKLWDSLKHSSHVRPSHAAKSGGSQRQGEPSGIESTSGGDSEPQPDIVLQNMNVIIDKKLDNTSVQAFYDQCVVPQSFYAEFLRETGKSDILVGDWVVAPPDEPFVEPYSDEKFSRKRTVNFQFERSSFAQHGPKTVDVKQTQFCRLEGSNKCVVSTLVETSGSPFSKSFRVNLRWSVTSQSGSNGILIKVGMFVVFLNDAARMMARKIKAGATQEATKSQAMMVRRVRLALGGELTKKSIQKKFDFDHQQGVDPSETCVPFLHRFDLFSAGAMIEDDDELSRQVSITQAKLKAVKAILDSRVSGENQEDMNFYLSQLGIVSESLDSVLKFGKSSDEASNALTDASFLSNE